MSALYNTDILRLATNIPHLGRLEDAQAHVELRAPVCGSRVAIDVSLDDAGRVAVFAQTVNACALGQASAALLGAHVIGCSLAEVATARDALRDYLKGARDDFGDWPGLGIFAAARPHSARHASILLPFEATAEAMKCAVEKTKNVEVKHAA